MISPACSIELVEVVGRGRIGVHLLVEVLLPGRRGERKEEDRRKGEVGTNQEGDKVALLIYNRRAILIWPLASFPDFELKVWNKVVLIPNYMRMRLSITSNLVIPVQ